MGKPRIFLDTDLQAAYRAGRPVCFDDNGHRHAVQVLRLKPGAAVILFDDHGGEYEATLDEVNKRRVSARITAFDDRSVESPLAITLIQGISRGERMDLTLQKATELGVSDIVPVTTGRCGVHLTAERQAKRLHHWRGVVTAACQQSGRTRLPRIADIAPLAAWLAEHPAGDELRLILDPTAGQGLSRLASGLSTSATRVVLLIGPEGGLEDDEIELAVRGGFTRVALGPRILRTETAGITAMAVIQTLWGDL
jgi:16S rRNA (uracil1498-N3)-methyltransferase